MKMPFRPVLVVVLSLALSSSALARVSTQAPLKLNKTVDFNDHKGKSCFQMMTMDGGIRDMLDEDEKTTFEVADKDTILKAKDDFDSGVYTKLVRLFKGDEKGLEELVDGLQGQKVTPLNISAAIAKQLSDRHLLKDPSKVGLAAVTLAPFISLASGAGTVVLIDKGNYYYNYGYKPGMKTSDDTIDKDVLDKAVKSGRSFGASPGHKALDASDVFYLTELAKYLESSKDFSRFYGTLFTELISIDPEAYSKLDTNGQTVATDFFAIYTAELDRHLMTALKSHPWENDLAEATMLSAYIVRSGKLLKGDKLVSGTPKDLFGVGRQGSGIGETRRDRRTLQAKISKAVEELDGGAKVVQTLTKLIGERDDNDLFRGITEYLNNPRTQNTINKNSDDLIGAITDFLTLVADNSDDITKIISK